MTEPSLASRPFRTETGLSRRRLLLGALGAPALGALAACGGGGDDRPQDPLLRFVNGTRDVSLASFYVDNILATSVNIGGNGSVYGALFRGTHTVAVKQGERELERVQLAFPGDSRTTVVAYGSAATGGDVRFWVIDESSALPPLGRVRVRAFHGAVHHQQVRLAVHIGAADAPLGTPTFTLDAYETRSAFVELPAGTYRVRVTPAADPSQVLLDSADAILPADTVWQLAVVPRSASSTKVNIAAIRERGDGRTWTDTQS